MAWTAPRDWTAISGGIVTAASLNTDVRDNLGVLSTHTHTGAAGFGASSLSGVTLAALVTLTFANQSANPDAAGELQRNGNDLLFYGSSAVNLTAADASAGTASLRSLSTSSTTAAAGNHTHLPGTPNQLVAIATISSSGTPSAPGVTVVSGTIVCQDASTAIAVSAVFAVPVVADNDYNLFLDFSGPTSGRIETADMNVANVIAPLPSSGSTAGLIASPSAGTYTITASIQCTDTGNAFTAYGAIFAREVGK